MLSLKGAVPSSAYFSQRGLSCRSQEQEIEENLVKDRTLPEKAIRNHNTYDPTLLPLGPHDPSAPSILVCVPPPHLPVSPSLSPRWKMATQRGVQILDCINLHRLYYLLIHLFTQQIFIKHPLYSRPCSRCWGRINEQHRQR